ncbi:DUF4998 domain-containing protein [Aestuariibaculum suncheonense]|uniref:DUF5013 domain-containing protein n=1 Tax=Aestuariibaculum suncheonense TaxID=1028745 RepID=A0A8J6Q5P0_9FLAO|nr:DUF4998 domain-containing protein [Aestuariibaculum suncheonense]MBD0834817.1 DUF5013 domain-containing protein [Aestuariibaculum suncheonense]
MKLKLNYAVTLLFLSLILGVLSCGSEEYPDINNYDDSIGVLESFVVRPGLNMVLIEGVIDNPSISEVVIYWNDQSESVAVPVVDGAISVQIDNLEEKLYVFEAKAKDAQGKSSDFITAGTKVYGASYVESLENRMISISDLVDSYLSLTFGNADLSTGILGTELVYQNTEGENVELTIDSKKNQINISDFMSGSTLKHRSYYLFSPLSLDTLYTDYVKHKPFVLPELGNAAVPFIAEEVSGRWGTLAAPWITNEAAKNHGGLGGWDEWNGNIFNLESGWGSPYIVDGKIYQVIAAEPANYRLTIEVLSTNHDSNPDGAYFVITKGNVGIPNVVDVESASEVIGYQRIGAAGTYTVDFVLDESSEICIGEVATQNGNFFCNIISWSLGLSD